MIEINYIFVVIKYISCKFDFSNCANDWTNLYFKIRLPERSEEEIIFS